MAAAVFTAGFSMPPNNASTPRIFEAGHNWGSSTARDARSVTSHHSSRSKTAPAPPDSPEGHRSQRSQRSHRSHSHRDVEEPLSDVEDLRPSSGGGGLINPFANAGQPFGGSREEEQESLPSPGTESLDPFITLIANQKKLVGENTIEAIFQEEERRKSLGLPRVQPEAPTTIRTPASTVVSNIRPLQATPTNTLLMPSQSPGSRLGDFGQTRLLNSPRLSIASSVSRDSRRSDKSSSSVSNRRRSREAEKRKEAKTRRSDDDDERREHHKRSRHHESLPKSPKSESKEQRRRRDSDVESKHSSSSQRSRSRREKDDDLRSKHTRSEDVESRHSRDSGSSGRHRKVPTEELREEGDVGDERRRRHSRRDDRLRDIERDVDVKLRSRHRSDRRERTFRERVVSDRSEDDEAQVASDADRDGYDAARCMRDRMEQARRDRYACTLAEEEEEKEEIELYLNELRATSGLAIRQYDFSTMDIHKARSLRLFWYDRFNRKRTVEGLDQYATLLVFSVEVVSYTFLRKVGIDISGTTKEWAKKRSDTLLILNDIYDMYYRGRERNPVGELATSLLVTGLTQQLRNRLSEETKNPAARVVSGLGALWDMYDSGTGGGASGGANGGGGGGGGGGILNGIAGLLDGATNSGGQSAEDANGGGGFIEKAKNLASGLLSRFIDTDPKATATEAEQSKIDQNMFEDVSDGTPKAPTATPPAKERIPISQAADIVNMRQHDDEEDKPIVQLRRKRPVANAVKPKETSEKNVFDDAV